MIRQKYPFKQFILNDFCEDLIVAYKCVRDDVGEFIKRLMKMQNKYYNFSPIDQKKYFLERREAYNLANMSDLDRSVLFVFLNKTCFKGLYRVNSSGLFNSPFGYFQKPAICDENNIRIVSELLQGVILTFGDFENTRKYIEEDTFFYFDPPYRPLNKTSFVQYTKNGFSDTDQIRLYNYCALLEEMGIKWMLSNSDGRNAAPPNDFFDSLYQKFCIERLDISYGIDLRRRKMTELLIRNY